LARPKAPCSVRLGGNAVASGPDARPRTGPVNSFLVSTAVVSVAEIGDKTQLLAFLLASKLRKPIPIILGILVATLANHAGAAAIGAWFSRLIEPDVMRWLLGISFIAMGIWTLIPDKAGLDDQKQSSTKDGWGVFGTTVAAFFLLEMGDKTQIATMALAAKYSDLALVTAGTTFGMMLANVPAVLFGDLAAKKLPLALVRAVAALILVAVGVVALFGVMPGLPAAATN
jgi:putative Ca2+/H+ antiporter (TMEM165/GDT1 family)